MKPISTGPSSRWRPAPPSYVDIRSWSPEEEAQLLALFDSGMSASEIGQRLDRTRLAVYGRLQRFHKQQGRVSRTSGRVFAQRAG
ncbi:GcrA family cell cycle regulator [Bradyrhizobium sp. i1.15.2]|uniref:GcrA family cell cycle regulator n=1 Tax=Bradyrhizobium sp. i1.15.2 TaxID=3156362 RepID=UPI003396E645